MALEFGNIVIVNSVFGQGSIDWNSVEMETSNKWEVLIRDFP